MTENGRLCVKMSHAWIIRARSTRLEDGAQMLDAALLALAIQLVPQSMQLSPMLVAALFVVACPIGQVCFLATVFGSLLVPR